MCRIPAWRIEHRLLVYFTSGKYKYQLALEVSMGDIVDQRRARAHADVCGMGVRPINPTTEPLR